MASFSIQNSSLKGNISKFFPSHIQEKILNKAKVSGYTIKEKQSIFAFSDEFDNATKYAGILRNKMGERLKLKDPNVLAFAWIVDFPMFEWDSNLEKWDFGHNPFSMPKGGLEALKNIDPANIQAEQFDLICNGYELASGSIRNHHPETFIEAFKIVGYSEKETRQKFGHMIESFEYGAPPHGGFAIGFDRLMMLLFDIENIREVYAFPKKNARELMTGAPREVDRGDLDTLGIELKDDK
jgi:aspartyl-tRNA synthetase